MNTRTRTQALKALDGMAEIVRNEMVKRGQYVTGVVDPRLAATGAICGGHQACAVGSLWIAAGVKPVQEYGHWSLPGVQAEHREHFFRRRPGLKAAYVALNEAAQRYVERHDIDLDEHSFMNDAAGPLERLFEHEEDDDGVPVETAVDRAGLLRIIASAKRSVKATA